MTHTSQALAWTLIHFCWQGAAVAALYRVVSMAVARLSSHIRYLVALAALLLMMAASVATLGWELNRDSSAPVIYSGRIAPDAHGELVDNSRIHAPSPTLEPGLVAVAPFLPSGFSLAAALPWIDAFWILGVVVLSLRSLGGWWLIQRLRAAASSPAPDVVRASFARIRAVMGIRRSVLLRVSNLIAGPVTVGAFRAVVLLPLSAISSLGPEELEVVLAHELAHVRRADFLWNLVQALAEALFFFHPAVWWINARIREERELCCDDIALTVCPNPVVYADALYHLEEHRRRQLRLAMALDGHQSTQRLRMRISRILGEPTAHRTNFPQPFSLVAACAGLVVLLLPAPQVLASLHPAAAPVTAPTVSIEPRPSPEPAGAHPAAAVATARVAMPAPHPVIEVGSVLPQESDADKSAEKVAESTAAKSSYIDQMKAAGYDVDLDKLIAMKIQNVTPEYARAMAKIGFGKPTADELIACKIQGVTADYIAQVRQQGLDLKSLQDAISFRIFEITPQFVADMKAAGFDHLSSQQLLALRVQGVTPEYARSIAKQFPSATAEDLVKTRIFNIDAAFIAEANKHGFSNLSLEKLVQLRISGLLDDQSVKP